MLRELLTGFLVFPFAVSGAGMCWLAFQAWDKDTRGVGLFFFLMGIAFLALPILTVFLSLFP